MISNSIIWNLLCISTTSLPPPFIIFIFPSRCHIFPLILIQTNKKWFKSVYKTAKLIHLLPFLQIPLPSLLLHSLTFPSFTFFTFSFFFHYPFTCLSIITSSPSLPTYSIPYLTIPPLPSLPPNSIPYLSFFPSFTCPSLPQTASPSHIIS